MSEAENGTVALQTEQPAPGQVGLNMQLTPQGVVLSFPVNLGIDNATMVQLIKAYLQAHPELVQEIAREAIAQKQQELAFIEMVKRSKNNGG
jgi:predicted glycoside hydrolase/deacetylase ChbG (UPF0249 family)